MRETLGERLLRHSVPEPNSGCWLWLRGCSEDGYGRVRVGGVQTTAHRASYRAFVGEIPAGLTIDHLCRVRCCINPRHLEAVTMEENWRRAENFAHTQALQTSCLRGHPLAGENLLVGRDGHRRCRICRDVHVRRFYEKEVREAKAAGLGIMKFRLARRAMREAAQCPP
jgi:hypothetical protein